MMVSHVMVANKLLLVLATNAGMFCLMSDDFTCQVPLNGLNSEC